VTHYIVARVHSQNGLWSRVYTYTWSRDHYTKQYVSVDSNICKKDLQVYIVPANCTLVQILQHRKQKKPSPLSISPSQEPNALSVTHSNNLRPPTLPQHPDRLLQQRDRKPRHLRRDLRFGYLVERQDGVQLARRRRPFMQDLCPLLWEPPVQEHRPSLFGRLVRCKVLRHHARYQI